MGPFPSACLVILLAACAPTAPAATSFAPASASATPSLPANWQTLAPGVEGRSMSLPAGPDDIGPVTALVLRLDPAQVAIRVHYDPAQPVPVGQWQTRTGAAVLVNAGFFQEDYAVAGLLVAGGVVYGASFDQINAAGYEWGGMFGVSAGALEIRSTEAYPYQPGEPLDEAVQGLPLLLDGGIPVNFDLPPRPTRRTVVALDASDRLLLIAVMEGAVTLATLRDWLASTEELSLSSALNLDGGPSTGIAIQLGEWSLLSDSYTPVSSVIAIYP